MKKNNVDWEKLCKIYEVHAEEITDMFYKLTQVQLNMGKNEKIEKIIDELDVAIAVFEDIHDFIREEQFSNTNADYARIEKYVIDRIDGLTEMCPILYSLSHDSAKENAETN